MAFDTYMTFIDPSGTALQGESQVDKAAFNNDQLAKNAPAVQAGTVFEIDDFSFDIEQVLNIGSQSSGAGAGKVTFNPFQITRKSDRVSAQLFAMCCGGQHFKQVVLCLRRAGGDPTSSSGTTFLRFDFGLVAVKTISWSGSDGDESPKEEVTFEYGALKVTYAQQNVDGTAMPSRSSSWNRVWNTKDFDGFVQKYAAT
jgi:type VI secretion system secreted protein Hcp